MTPLPTSSARQYGKVFDEVAAEYDRNRPTYPDELVDQACQVAGIGDGDRVLEIGCGTGQLTRSLVARGLHVTALEPGRNLVALARQNLEDAGAVEFVNARFEDAPLPREHFRAVFSASALHWVDPTVSWRKIADVLIPGGTLALISYFGLEEERTKHDQEASLAAIRKVAPDIAATWPVYRDLDATLAGVEQRRENVSEVWSWLGSHDLAQDYVGGLFGDAQAAAKSSTLSWARCRFTPGSQRTSAESSRMKSRLFTNASAARFARARSRSSSRLDAVRLTDRLQSPRGSGSSEARDGALR
jgi:ubiquinone/menaquinone biosynthesis C-methylase UbiE